MPVMKTSPFVFSAEMYCVMDVVNSQGNSGTGTLVKWITLCVVESQHFGLCLSTWELHVFFLSHAAAACRTCC